MEADGRPKDDEGNVTLKREGERPLIIWPSLSFLINTYHTQCGQTKLSREWDGDGEIGATASQIRVCPPISSTLTRKRTSWKQIVA